MRDLLTIELPAELAAEIEMMLDDRAANAKRTRDLMIEGRAVQSSISPALARINTARAQKEHESAEVLAYRFRKAVRKAGM